MTSITPPPSRIYLLRHAEGRSWAAPGQQDFDRPLNDKGYAEAEIVADNAADKGYQPDLVICSTALRCRQTADAIHRAMGPSTRDSLRRCALQRHAGHLSRDHRIQATADSVMLVGHNPTIEQTLEALIGHDALRRAHCPTAFRPPGLAVLDFDNVGREPGFLTD